MSKTRYILILVTSLILILSACGVSETPTSAPEVIEEAETQEELPTQDEGEVTQEVLPTEEEGEEATSAPEIDPEAIFADRCARCHGVDRSGRNGPALLPERLTKDASVYQSTITNGSGPMPSFGDKLSADEINAMVDFILSDPQ